MPFEKKTIGSIAVFFEKEDAPAGEAVVGARREPLPPIEPELASEMGIK